MKEQRQYAMGGAKDRRSLGVAVVTFMAVGSKKM